MDSKPVSEVFGFWLLDLSWTSSAGSRHSRIRLLLPEPLTPVTRTNRPKGKLTVRFLRLFFAALCSVSHVTPILAPGLTLDFGLWTLDSPFTGRRWPRAG